ncbi:TonB-dependent receptor [Methylobacter sp.]|uniref:TonB-dependent receptor n=1 Tax=Methylobacter sp. TaxID=2051955 RepID=UPI002FDEB47B
MTKLSIFPVRAVNRASRHAYLKSAAFAAHLTLAGAVITGGIGRPACAETAAAQYDIPAGPLGEALNRFAQQAGVAISVDASKVQGLRTQGLHGGYSVEEGFNTLLRSNGYVIARTAAGYVLLPAPEPVSAVDMRTLPVVKVTANAEIPGDLPKAYPGGQVARGGRLGILGNRDIMDVPFNITSYTAEHIENQQARTVAEVLVSDPSVRFTTSAGHMYENYRIRGFPINASELALNGMYGLTPYGHVATEFVERVEVLKGPNALLSGMSPSGAVGGAINLVPKRADDKPLIRVTGDYTSESQFGTHLDVGRRLGADHQFGIRFNGAYRDGDTMIDNQSKNRNLAALALDFRGERLKLSVDAYTNEERIKNGSSMMASFSGTTVPGAPDSSTNQFLGINGKFENQALVGRGEYAFNDDLTAYAGVGAQRFRFEGFINSTHTRNVNAAGAYTGYTTNQRGYTDTLSAEAGLRGHFKTWAVDHQLVLSGTSLDLDNGSVFRTGANYLSSLYKPATPILAADPGAARKTAETTLSSIALADTMSFAGDKVQLILGGRYQQVQTKNFSTTTGLQTSNYDQGVVTPAVGVVVKPWQAPVSLYVNYIEGLSQGDTVTDTTASNYGHMFAPYQTEQVEVGGKWDMGKFANTLSLFQVTKPSMVKNGNIYNADGEQRNRGIEWNMFGEIVEDVRLLGGAVYTEGVMTKSAGGVLNGKTTFGTPEWQSNLGVEWDIPWLSGMTLQARGVYTSSQYVNSANTQKIPSWMQFDLGARYAMRLQEKNVVLRANVTNLFDKDYWAGSFSDGFTTLSPPRTVMLSATVDF